MSDAFAFLCSLLPQHATPIPEYWALPQSAVVGTTGMSPTITARPAIQILDFTNLHTDVHDNVSNGESPAHLLERGSLSAIRNTTRPHTGWK
jgi:hypothetical protein